jgi:hypothetical protein
MYIPIPRNIGDTRSRYVKISSNTGFRLPVFSKIKVITNSIKNINGEIIKEKAIVFFFINTIYIIIHIYASGFFLTYSIYK